MASPAQQLADILTTALNKWVKDNPGLVGQPTVNVTGGGSSPAPGGASDLVGLIVGLVGIGLALDPEAFGILGALDQVQGAGGEAGSGFAAGWFVGENLLSFSEPYTRILVHALEASVVSQIFDPDVAAELQSKGIIDHTFAVSEAAGGGLDGQHVSYLVEHAYRYPGLPEAFRLFNLGQIDQATLSLIMDRQGVPPALQTQLQTLTREFLSVADLALASLRGDIDPDDALSYAEQLGMTVDDFNLIIGNTGEPPGTMQLLEAFRRGDIDEARLQRGIRQSRVRNEWFDVIVALRYQRMSAANAVDATVQDHLTPEQGKAAAALAGLYPDDFDVLLQTAGEPLSRTEMTELVNRGKATVADYAQAMRESRLKNKYIPFAEELLVKLIPYRTINTILAHGVQDHQWGIDYLMKLGYTADDAASLVATSTSSKTAHIKQLTEAQILVLYEGDSISREEAITELGNIGYQVTEADFILQYTDAKRAVSEQNKAITYLRDGYLAHRITIQEASSSMDAIGVPPGQRDKLLKDWEIERTSQVKVLTPAQIGAAVKWGVVPFADAQAKLVEMGYSDNDAKVLLGSIAEGVPKGVVIDPIS